MNVDVIFVNVYNIFYYQFEAVIVFFILCFFLPLVLALITFILFLDTSGFEPELETTYECGFIPFNDRYLEANINFQKIAVLFIIFDLEIVFLFPWAVSFLYVGYVAFLSMFLFLILLVLGLYFEFKTDILTI